MLMWSGPIESKSTSSGGTDASAKVCIFPIFILTLMIARSSTRDFSVTRIDGGRGDAAVIDVEGEASGVLDEFGPDPVMISEVDEAVLCKAADIIPLLTRSRVETISRLSNSLQQEQLSYQ